MMDYDTIEDYAELSMDHLDSRYLKGMLSDHEYDDAVKRLREWVTKQYNMHRSNHESA